MTLARGVRGAASGSPSPDGECPHHGAAAAAVASRGGVVRRVQRRTCGTPTASRPTCRGRWARAGGSPTSAWSPGTPGRAVATVTCCTGTTGPDGRVDVLVVAEEVGVGLGGRCAGLDRSDPGRRASARASPSCGSGSAARGSRCGRCRPARAAGDLDRSVLAGEAAGAMALDRADAGVGDAADEGRVDPAGRVGRRTPPRGDADRGSGPGLVASARVRARNRASTGRSASGASRWRSWPAPATTASSVSGRSAHMLST